MQPVTRVLRHPAPPAAASMAMPPPPPPASPSNRAPPPRSPELPLPSALVPPKKRWVFRTPPKATVPLPPPPPFPAAPTPPPQADNADPPLFSVHKPSPPSPPAADNPSSPPPPPPAYADEIASAPPLPPAAGKPSSPPPPADADEKPSAPRPPPAAENPSSPPPPAGADDKHSAPPPTDAAAEPAPTRKVRRITRKVRNITRKVVPKGTIAARKAAAGVASAAAGAIQPGKGHAPDSHRNAAADEVVEKEQTFGENTIEKPAASCNPVAVRETLCNPIDVRGTLLGQGTLGEGTLANGPAMDMGDDPEVEKLGSKGDYRVEVGMSERQRRRMTEVFVGGLNRDAKEEDVRAVLSVAGEITEIRMIMDASTKKNKGYCFVRYHKSAQARKAIAQFSNVKICGKQCRVAALDGNDKIFLGNINKKWKKEDILKLLQKVGVENIDVVTLVADSNNPGCNRGFAFLELETYRDAQIAYRKLSRKEGFGKGLNIRVDWAEPLNGPDEKQMQKVSHTHKFCVSEKAKTKTAKSERELGLCLLHILPSSLQVLRELAPRRPEHTGSGNLIQDYPHILSGEKRPFSALGIGSCCMSRNPHARHEKNTYATSTSRLYQILSDHHSSSKMYSAPYHRESRRCVPDSDSVLTGPWGGVQIRQVGSHKSGMPHGSRH